MGTIFTSVHCVVSWILNDPDLPFWVTRFAKRSSDVCGQVISGGLFLGPGGGKVQGR